MKNSIRSLVEARRAGKDDEGGFTLIELLIVIVVLGILAAIVVFAVQNLSKDSAAAACRADAKTVEVGLEAARTRSGAYPGGLTAATFTPITATVPTTGTPATPFVGTTGGYIRSAPKQTRYVIGLKGTGTVSDGVVYVFIPGATAGTETDFNAAADPCQNAL